jgi:glycosyltransferase involved in cell wall biosynthesis
LLKAWQLVIAYCKDHQLPLPFLVLAGRLDDTYNQLRLLGFDLNLSDHVGFTGAINPVQGLIKQSLFCVFSSNLEGCPNGVLECMEQGKAVVGTHISGVEQALGTTYAAQCLSQPNNPKDLADKLLNLYQQPQLMVAIGAYNADRIRTEFSVKQMVAKHLQIIEDKLNKSKIL